MSGRPRLQARPEVGEQLAGSLALRPTANEKATPEFLSEEDVLGNVERLGDAEVLVNHANAGRLGAARRE